MGDIRIIFAVLLIFVSINSITPIVIPEGIKQAILETHDICMEESKANLADLQKCRVNHIPDEQTSKCYLECMTRLVEVKVMEGIAVIQDIEHFLNEDILELAHIVKSSCDHLEHVDKCTDAWLKANCYLKTHPDVQDFCNLLMFN